MTRTQLILLLVAGLLLVGLLTLAFMATVGASLALPVAYLAWLAGLVFRSVPQWLWWAWFLLMAFVIAAKSFSTRDRGALQPPPNEIVSQGPVRAWTRRVYLATKGSYFRWRLAHDLAELCLSLQAYHDRRGLARYNRREYIEELAAPPQVQAYFRAGLASQPMENPTLFSRLTRWWRSNASDLPVDLDPQIAVSYLEDQLESRDDR
jgi:hypothetical protein